MIEFVFKTEPVAKGVVRGRFTKKGFIGFRPKKTTKAINEIRNQLKSQLPNNWSLISKDTPIKATVVFVRTPPKNLKNHHPTTRPDLDNFLKLIWDALTGFVFEDDSSIVEINAQKVYGNPSIKLKLEWGDEIERKISEVPTN